MKIDLKKTSALDLVLDTEKPEIAFGRDFNFSKPGIRTLKDMREVLLDKDIVEPEELYYMYRDVFLVKDKALLEKNKLRYDVTVIKPDYLGRELMKTAGHYHPRDFGELYEVVNGRCFCLLQRPNASDHTVIEEVILVEASAGQKIVIPPWFGHILVNPGPEYLVTSNWVSSAFSSEYDLYKKAQGAAYFILKSNDGRSKLAINPYFKEVPKVKFVKPSPGIDKFGLREGVPMYPAISQGAEKLAFLNRPSDFDYTDVFVESPEKLNLA